MRQGQKLNVVVFLLVFTSFLGIKTNSNAININYTSNFNCADNALAPLNSVLDIQTYLSCNGFEPGPLDGVRGNKTTQAIKSFQYTVGLSPDGVVGPATKQAMRGYSATTFTFKAL